MTRYHAYASSNIYRAQHLSLIDRYHLHEKMHINHK